jgi:hypothetical protein
MKKINITIPDNLNEIQEAKLIQEKLTQKALSGNGNNLINKRIGDEVIVKDLVTQITIKRTGEKPVELMDCPICKTQFQNNFFNPVFTNYGGVIKRHKTCSNNCQQNFIEFCGDGRASVKRKDLKPLIDFNKH